jgi:hypothetical protein
MFYFLIEKMVDIAFYLNSSQHLAYGCFITVLNHFHVAQMTHAFAAFFGQNMIPMRLTVFKTTGSRFFKAFCCAFVGF